MLFVCVSVCDHLCLLGEIILAISLIFSVERICILKLADSVYIHIRVCVCVHIYIQFCSVQLLSPVLIFATPWMAACQVPWFITNSRRLLKLMSFSQYCHPNIMSSVVPFSSRLQFFPASGYLPMSQLFELSGQSIGVSASTWVLSMNIQD